MDLPTLMHYGGLLVEEQVGGRRRSERSGERRRAPALAHALRHLLGATMHARLPTSLSACSLPAPVQPPSRRRTSSACSWPTST